MIFLPKPLSCLLNILYTVTPQDLYNTFSPDSVMHKNVIQNSMLATCARSTTIVYKVFSDAE